MEPCIVKHLSIGSGLPKVCVPITSTKQQDIINDFIKIKDQDFELIELRIDFFDAILDDQKLISLLQDIKQLQVHKPIIFTYRSKKEGGNIQLSDNQYYHLLELACKSKCVDIIDIEYQSKEANQLISLVHQYQLPVILSNHNFHSTPNKEVLIERLQTMQSMQGDILKIAVMPRNSKDVLTLLEATNDCYQMLDKPIVTMSMAGLGAISRMVGEVFGSAITFAMIGKPSAPGQIELEKLKQVLAIVHQSK